MIERENLNLDFEYPSERSSFLLGSVALYKRFQQERITNDDIFFYLNALSKKDIPVYEKGPNPTQVYYKRGILDKDRKSLKKKGRIINQYRVIPERRRKVEQELKKTDYVKYLGQIDEFIASSATSGGSSFPVSNTIYLE